MGDLGSILFFLIVVGLAILLLWFFIFKVKHLKTPDVFMVDGGVKVGKSFVTVSLAVKQYRRNLRRYYIGNLFIKFLNLLRKKKPKKLIEKPMLYCNMPLYKVKYNELTLEIILQQVRIPHKSVVLIDEATLLADSMSGMVNGKKGKEGFDYVNEKLTIFLKTFGHMTHGGACFYNSQQVVDLHFAFKRCTSTYLLLTKNRKFPFFCLLECRELVHDESGDVVNTIQKDVDEDNKPLFVSKKWYHYYDRYYLDVLTKNLPLYVNYDVKPVPYFRHQELKKIVTLSNYQVLKDFNSRGSKNA